MSYNLSISPSCPDPNLGPSLAQVCPGSQFLTFMSLLNTFVLAKEEISLLCERFKPVEPAEYYYDFIVVGGEYKPIIRFRSCILIEISLAFAIFFSLSLSLDNINVQRAVERGLLRIYSLSRRLHATRYYNNKL